MHGRGFFMRPAVRAIAAALGSLFARRFLRVRQLHVGGEHLVECAPVVRLRLRDDDAGGEGGAGPHPWRS